VRALEVVVLDVEPEPPIEVREIGEHGPRQELVPQRLPEALDLAQGLRVLRTALDVTDPVLPHQLLERGLTPPGCVLPALIRQHLARDPVVGDAALERLEHQLRALVVRQRVRDHVTAVVVEEPRQVHPLVAAKVEGEDVRLPELVRLGPLESPWPLLARLAWRRRIGNQPLLVQDSPHLGLRDAQAGEPRQDVPDASGAPLRVLLPRRHHRLVTRRLGWRRLRRLRPRKLRPQRVDTPVAVERHVLLHRRRRHPERQRHIRLVRPPQHLSHDP
jgi:hypothetical protein